jgi:hypothetical protein
VRGSCPVQYISVQGSILSGHRFERVFVFHQSSSALSVLFSEVRVFGKFGEPAREIVGVVDTESDDQEHQLRRDMGDLFERDPDAKGGHTSADVEEFYEQCLEMMMIRVARTRRALRGRRYELVFGYTSGPDLIGHVPHDRPDVQQEAYDELNQFVGEFAGDLRDDDALILVSDHGL